ncbi:MAG: ABC transporter substrate-binding protein [Pseudomonadota bacterium]
MLTKKYFIIIAILLLSISAIQAKPLVVVLDWFLNPDHAPLIVAQQQGFFKKEGLDVKLTSPAQTEDAIKLVAAGKADVAVTYQPRFITIQSRGLPVERVGTLIGAPLDCILALKNGPITSIKKLKGKKVGYEGTGLAILKRMLQYNGLKLSDVKLIQSSGNMEQALLSHKIDAFIGGYRNFEAIEMTQLGHPPRIFYPEENGVPLYDELILVSNKKEANSARIKKFMRAVQEGAVYLVNHPRQTWETFAKNHPELNNKLNKAAWFKTIPYFAINPLAYDQQRYDNIAAFVNAKKEH